MPAQKIFLAIVLCFHSVLLSAQLQVTDTLFLTTAVNNAKAIHERRVIAESNLYNGSDFAEYQPIGNEHPYLYSDDWINGSVEYSGEFYENVSLLYDIHNDNLIIENYNYGAKVELVKQNIGYFILNGHIFRRLEDQTIKPGFYDVLYDGKTKVFARYEKEILEQISSNQLSREFTEKTKYYLEKDGVYFHVKSKGSVLKILKDHKQELNQALHRNKIKFSVNREFAIIELARIYDSIKK